MPDETPDDGFDDDDEDWADEGDDGEPIGTCDNCDCDLYQGDGVEIGNEILCDQCAFWRTHA